jgi:hypothetical protein
MCYLFVLFWGWIVLVKYFLDICRWLGFLRDMHVFE